MAMPREPKRSPDQTTLTVSLSKSLKQRIEAAAAAEKRTVSNWCVVELEKILDVLQTPIPRSGVSYHDRKPLESLKVAEDEGKRAANE